MALDPPDTTLTTDTTIQPAPKSPLEQVGEWLDEAQSVGDITASIKNLWPHEDPEALILTAVDELAKVAISDVQPLRGWCLRARLMLFRKLHETGDYAAARQVINDVERSLK